MFPRTYITNVFMSTSHSDICFPASACCEVAIAMAELALELSSSLLANYLVSSQ